MSKKILRRPRQFRVVERVRADEVSVLVEFAHDVGILPHAPSLNEKCSLDAAFFEVGGNVEGVLVPRPVVEGQAQPPPETVVREHADIGPAGLKRMPQGQISLFDEMLQTHWP
ncbi:MAG: hypothetical protein M5R36_13820 [Deltaproteobacteria bacterium]|nr:hypothetical protein [Deltaproteobacteria bacterium]